MKNELSILLPTFNNICLPLVEQLQQQAAAIEGLQYEVIVADDGSTDKACIAANRPIDSIDHCRYLVRETNVGRAAIRNFLARQARYEWLLFLDSDMSIGRSDFLSAYLCGPDAKVIYGGYAVGQGPQGNLRYLYEKEAEPRHTVAERQRQPYRDFHTSNFLISREIMLQQPFDERFRHYGYEDVLLGKRLRQAGMTIAHIDNPAGFDTFEANAHFVAKTEEGLRTLHEFRRELRGYNGLLTLVDGIHIGIVKSLIRLYHRLAGSLERRWLCSNHPSLTVFRLYKLGYYLSLN